MKKFMSIIIIVAMLIIPFNCYASVDKKQVNSKSSILMCMDTGEVIYSSNEYKHLSPASVTKIMSILLVLEALDRGDIKLSDKVTASENAVSMGGSQIWLEVGETMTVDELLKAVIVASANDACTALGEFVSGSSTGFVSKMNSRAEELGLKNTHFENCTGLDDETTNHYSCAYDLAVIATEVMKYDIVTKYSTIWLDSLRGGKTELNNTNKLVNKYKGITGLKTGTTSNAGFCVAATAKRDNMNLVAVVLGADTSDKRFDTASYLLDYGFANYKLIKTNVNKNKIKYVKVQNGVKKFITPKINNNKLLVKNNAENITYKYNIKSTVTAPIKKGDTLGTIDVYNDNTKLSTIKLTSNISVKKVSLMYIWHNILTNM